MQTYACIVYVSCIYVHAYIITQVKVPESAKGKEIEIACKATDAAYNTQV